MGFTARMLTIADMTARWVNDAAFVLLLVENTSESPREAELP